MGAFAADLRRCADIDQTRQGLVLLFAHNFGLHALLAYRLGRWLRRAASRYYLWPLLPFGWWHYLRRARIINGVRVGFLGVMPEHQHTGAAALLYMEHYDMAEKPPPKTNVRTSSRETTLASPHPRSKRRWYR